MGTENTVFTFGEYRLSTVGIRNFVNESFTTDAGSRNMWLMYLDALDALSGYSTADPWSNCEDSDYIIDEAALNELFYGTI